MTTDSCSLPGRRGDVAQVVGLRSTSEGAGLEVRLVHAAALERASPCVERSHPTGARHSARGELIKLIVDQPVSFVGYSFSFLIRDARQSVSLGEPIDRVQRGCVSSEKSLSKEHKGTERTAGGI